MTKSNLPTSVMVWSVHDPVIENRELLESQFNDLVGKGFDGLAVWVRCSRYTWDHPAAMSALKRISSLCKKEGIACWLGPDPRFISRRLIGENNGLPIVLYGDDIHPTRIPNFTLLTDDQYRVRCRISPRHTHMHHEVAIEFYPVGVLRVYAVRVSQGPIGKKECLDITSQTNFFYHAKEHYVEAFGRFQPPDHDQWQIVAFFLVKSSHVDFSSESHYKHYLERLKELASHVRSLDMIMFDEPGYTCVYGALPFSNMIRKRFMRQTGLDLANNLWQFAVESSDKSHTGVRNQYFNIVQETVIDFQKRTWRASKKLWSKTVLFGIHDTWHFESADMADMNHGSMDLWKSLSTKSGGFVDLGGINMLRDPGSGYYAHLAAMSVICKSLGKFSLEKFCYNNLWTIDDDNGEGWQSSTMNYCVKVLALFGQRWIPHAYGPVGTVGEEDKFLGSPPLPGYPNHSTWKDFLKWNKRLKNHFSAVEGRLPWANILLVYPVDFLYSKANQQANDCAINVFLILLALLDNHFHVDVISARLLTGGKWRNDNFHLNGYEYESVVYPYPQNMDERSSAILASGIESTCYVFVDRSDPVISKIKHANIASDIRSLIKMLIQNDLRPVKAPKNSWISLTKLNNRVAVSIAPSRHTFEYEGELCYREKNVLLSKSSDLQRLFFG